MRHSANVSLRPAGRTALLGALVVAVVAASGCSWFRKDAQNYAMSAEQRPLEIPPDLDHPQVTGVIEVPDAPTSALRSEVGASRTTASAPAAATGSGFLLAAEKAQAFARVGEVLAGIQDLEIASKAELLGAYDVSYKGSNFLVRVTPVEGGSFISAVDPRGVAADGEGPTSLMALLEQQLAGN